VSGSLTRHRPVIGSFLTVRKSWRWTQWTLIFFAIFSFIVTLFTSETYKKTILTRRAKRLNISLPPSPFPTAAAKIRFMLAVTLLRPLHMLATEPIVAFLSIYVSFNFSVLFSFFAAFPYVFQSVYHFSVEGRGLVFLAIGVGCILAVPTVLICDRYLYQPRVRASKAAGSNGIVAPEYRLYPAMMGSFGLPIGLFVSPSVVFLRSRRRENTNQLPFKWFAWTARPDVSWASPVVSAVPFAWGNLSIFIGFWPHMPLIS
jgi:hypothetical protein